MAFAFWMIGMVIAFIFSLSRRELAVGIHSLGLAESHRLAYIGHRLCDAKKIFAIVASYGPSLAYIGWEPWGHHLVSLPSSFLPSGFVPFGFLPFCAPA